MAVQNHIYIYIGKGAPTILNVDNAADGTVLEQLGALKMPEAMAAEIFGENIQYADNTTCTITDNPDNAEFPYTVVFDSSKILVKPKRNTSMFAELAMPSSDFINIPITINNPASYTASANGYVYLHFGTGAGGAFSSLLELTVYSDSSSILSVRDILKDASWSGNSIFVPVKKGQSVSARMDVSGTYPKPNYVFRFVYAEGEI